MVSDQQLGFPTPLLGMRPVRLPVLLDDGEVLALAKPQGVLVQQDSWYPRLPVLIEAIRHQAAGGKPEFLRAGIGAEGLWAVTDLDPELQGPVLFSRIREQADELRNACGSGAFLFSFLLVSKGLRPDPVIECELPLSRHSHLPRILVSHTSGKKAHTTFTLQGQAGGFYLWSATTAFPRRHQVLLHALECGLPVLGDPIYAKDPAILLSRFKRDYTQKRDIEERPLYDGPACFLQQIQLPDGRQVAFTTPPGWTGLLGQLGKHTRP